MANVTLRATPRASGKANWTRREDQIPAVVYGKGVPSQAIAVRGKELHQVLERGASRLIHLVFDGFDRTVMVKEVQRHPVRGHVVHVDFHAVEMDRPIRAQVPLFVSGEEAVSSHGGIVQHQMREVEIECLPAAIPSHLSADVSRLHVGEHVCARDLALPPGVRLVTDPDDVVVTVVAPRVAEEPAEEEPEQQPAAAAPTAPEQPPK